MSNPDIKDPAVNARAVQARIAGVWDDPALMAFGPLSTDTGADVAAIRALVK